RFMPTRVTTFFNVLRSMRPSSRMTLTSHSPFREMDSSISPTLLARTKPTDCKRSSKVRIVIVLDWLLEEAIGELDVELAGMKGPFQGVVSGERRRYRIGDLHRDFGLEATARRHDAMRVVRHRIADHSKVLCGGYQVFHQRDSFASSLHMLGRYAAAQLLLFEHEALRQIPQPEELVQLSLRILLPVSNQQREVALVTRPPCGLIDVAAMKEFDLWPHEGVRNRFPYLGLGMLMTQTVEPDAATIAEETARIVRRQNLVWIDSIVNLGKPEAPMHRMARKLVQVPRVMHLLVGVAPQDPIARGFVDGLISSCIESVSSSRLLRNCVGKRTIREVSGQLPTHIERSIGGLRVDADDDLVDDIHK